MERVKGIEPSQPAWKAGILPLNYTRIFGDSPGDRTPDNMIKSHVLYQLS